MSILTIFKPSTGGLKGQPIRTAMFEQSCRSWGFYASFFWLTMMLQYQDRSGDRLAEALRLRTRAAQIYSRQAIIERVTPLMDFPGTLRSSRCARSGHRSQNQLEQHASLIMFGHFSKTNRRIVRRSAKFISAPFCRLFQL